MPRNKGSHKRDHNARKENGIEGVGPSSLFNSFVSPSVRLQIFGIWSY